LSFGSTPGASEYGNDAGKRISPKPSTDPEKGFDKLILFFQFPQDIPKIIRTGAPLLGVG
jgi:hypothetical protein